jgi:hypothetical protein
MKNILITMLGSCNSSKEVVNKTTKLASAYQINATPNELTKPKVPNPNGPGYITLTSITMEEINGSIASYKASGGKGLVITPPAKVYSNSRNESGVIVRDTKVIGDNSMKMNPNRGFQLSHAIKKNPSDTYPNSFWATTKDVDGRTATFKMILVESRSRYYPVMDINDGEGVSSSAGYRFTDPSTRLHSSVDIPDFYIDKIYIDLIYSDDRVSKTGGYDLPTVKRTFN